jgi:hypothetical protein
MSAMSAGFQAETIRRLPTDAAGSALTALIPATRSAIWSIARPSGARH